MMSKRRVNKRKRLFRHPSDVPVIALWAKVCGVALQPYFCYVLCRFVLAPKALFCYALVVVVRPLAVLPWLLVVYSLHKPLRLDDSEDF